MTAGILYQGTDFVWKLEQQCFYNKQPKGWEPGELSLVFNPDPSQLSFNKKTQSKQI